MVFENLLNISRNWRSGGLAGRNHYERGEL